MDQFEFLGHHIKYEEGGEFHGYIGVYLSRGEKYAIRMAFAKSREDAMMEFAKHQNQHGSFLFLAVLSDLFTSMMIAAVKAARPRLSRDAVVDGLEFVFYVDKEGKLV